MAFVEEPTALFLRATEVFKLFDTNGDGFLSKKELKASVAAIGGEKIPGEYVDDVFSNIDNAEIGVSFEVFLNLIKSKTHTSNAERDLLTSFKCFDKSRKGFITSVDLKNIFSSLFKQMPLETVDQIFEELDLNTKSQIDFDLFKKIMTCTSHL